MGKRLSREGEGNVVVTTKTLPFEGGLTLCTEQTAGKKFHIFADMVIDSDSNSNNETQIHNLLLCL